MFFMHFFLGKAGIGLHKSDHLQLDWLQNGENETQAHYKHYSACHFFPDLMHICCNVLLPLRVSGLKLIPIDNLVYTPKTSFTAPRFTDLVRNMPLKASPHKSTDYYQSNVLLCCSVNNSWKRTISFLPAIFLVVKMHKLTSAYSLCCTVGSYTLRSKFCFRIFKYAKLIKI